MQRGANFDLRSRLSEPSIGASTIRIAFWGPLYYMIRHIIIIRNPRIVLVIIWAPIFVHSAKETEVLRL